MRLICLNTGPSLVPFVFIAGCCVPELLGSLSSDGVVSSLSCFVDRQVAVDHGSEVVYAILATDVASTLVDYYPRVVFPLECGGSGPMGPSDSRGFPSQVIPFSRGFEAAQVALPLLSSSPLPLRDCSGSPILCSSLAVVFGRVAHVGVHVGRRHVLLLGCKRRSTKSQKNDSANSRRDSSRDGGSLSSRISYRQ